MEDILLCFNIVKGYTTLQYMEVIHLRFNVIKRYILQATYTGYSYKHSRVYGTLLYYIDI
jgi:hypothetical protein